MLDVKISDIKFDEHAINKLTAFLREMWFGTPRWLRNTAVAAVTVWIIYFLYTRITISYDMETLQNEVIELNNKCSETVFYDRYFYDVQQVVTSVKTIQNEIDELYAGDDELILIMEEYIRQTSPNDPILRQISSIKKKRESVKESYKKMIEH